MCCKTMQKQYHNFRFQVGLKTVGLKTEDWRLKTEDWRLKTEDCWTEDWRLKTEDWRLRTEDWRYELWSPFVFRLGLHGEGHTSLPARRGVVDKIQEIVGIPVGTYKGGTGHAPGCQPYLSSALMAGLDHRRCALQKQSPGDGTPLSSD